MSNSTENVIPDKLIPVLPTTEGVKCDKGICFVEMMFSYINDLLMKKKIITNPVKFSIHHFIQHIFNFSDIPDNRVQCKAEFPLPIKMCYVESYLASGSGPVLYEDDPTEISIESLIANNDKYKNKQIKVPYLIGTVNKIVDTSKRQEILTKSDVLVVLYISPDGINRENKSYYHNILYFFDSIKREDPSHCVKMIGYDDNYPKDKFNEMSISAAEDGAVLAEVHCIEGISYLWISYETILGMHAIYITDISINTKMYNVYEYDIIGECNAISSPEKEELINSEDGWYIYRTASMKNVFKTKDPGKEYLEYIKFGFYPNNDFEIIVMDGDEIVYHYIAPEDRSTCGYYSYKLDRPVLLTAESFSIEIRTHGRIAHVFTDGIKHNTPNICYINGIDITDEVTHRKIVDVDKIQGYCSIKALTRTKEFYKKENESIPNVSVVCSSMFDEYQYISTSSYPRGVVVEYYRDDHHNKLVKSICTKYDNYDDEESNDKMVLSLDPDEYVIGCSWTVVAVDGEYKPFEENMIGFKTNKREVNYDESGGFKCDEDRMIVGFYGGILDEFIRKIGFYTILCHENPIVKESESIPNVSIVCSTIFDEYQYISRSSYPRAVVVEYYVDNHHNKLIKSICTKYDNYDDVESNDKMVLSLDPDEYVIGCSWTVVAVDGEYEPFEENMIGFKTNKREVNYDESGSFKCDESRMIVGFYGGVSEDEFIRKIGFYTIPTF